jgi:sporulation protein YlmC with PRC-barrel domain
MAQTGYGRPQAGYGSAPNSIDIVTSANQPHGTGQRIVGDKFFHTRSLVGQLVKDAKGQTLGSIYDVTFNPVTGDIFAAIGVGIGRYVLVPWQALIVSVGAGGADELTLNTTLRDLQAGPVIANNQWGKLDDPDFNRSIYRYFKQPAPIAVGGTQGEDLGGVSTGSASGTAKEESKASSGPP